MDRSTDRNKKVGQVSRWDIPLKKRFSIFINNTASNEINPLLLKSKLIEDAFC
ncbi:MAG: hypothetical protein WC868_06675 [Bacteroidales bacterium]